ncbi:MAG: CAP domain-containing protein [Hyphomicrobium sp.]|nr:CAP domain-containing protein [Hyphomicrobium sp.]PPD08532.1 MAG: serine protease [Hyphomicrobium sp.]
MPLPDVPAVEQVVIEMTNAFRRENKLGQVTASPALTKAARAYAAYLAKNNAFSHTADNRDVGARATASGYQWCSIGENLAMNLDSRGFETRELARQTVEGWINSPGHKANLLGPHYTEIGVGVVQAPDKNPKYIAVQVFGRPQSAKFTFQIANATGVPVSYTFSGETHDLSPSMSVTHTACTPGALDFIKAGPKKVAAKFQAADQTVYTLKGDAKAGLKVELSKRATLE